MIWTHLKIWVKLDHLPRDRGENKECLSCHHQESLPPKNQNQNNSAIFEALQMLLRYATKIHQWERQVSSQLISKPVKQVGEKSRSTFARVLKKKRKDMKHAFEHTFYRYINNYNTFYHTFWKNQEGKCLYIQRRWTGPDHSGASAMLQPQRLKDHVLMYNNRIVVQMGSVTSYVYMVLRDP